MIERTDSEIEQVDEEIRALNSALDRLLDNRRQLVKKSQQLKAILSPIRLLPTEILVEIFKLCRRDEQDAMFPLDISHVGQRWRGIALSTPSL